MAAGRQNKSGAGWLVLTAFKALFLCMAITGAAVGYVWQKGQIVQLGQDIHQREVRLWQLSRSNQRMADQIAIMRSPVALDQRVRELNLGLRPLDPAQVIRLAEPAAPVSGVDSLPRQMAVRTDVVTP